MDNWLDYVIEEDREYVRAAWTSLHENMEPKRLVLVRRIGSLGHPTTIEYSCHLRSLVFRRSVVFKPR